MTVLAASGFSKNIVAFRAGQEAAKMALRRINKPSFIILFTSISYNQKEVLEGARSVTGDIPLIGGSSFGEVTNYGMYDNSVALMAIESDDIEFILSEGRDSDSDPINAGASAANCAVKKIDNNKSFQIGLFVAEMLANEKPLAGIEKILGNEKPLFGGCCSGNRKASIHDPSYTLGYQYLGGNISQHNIPLLLLSGDFQYSFGVAHGWEPLGNFVKVGKTEKKIVYELNDQKALDFYRRYLLDNNFTPHPLGLFHNNNMILRAVTGIHEDSALFFTTEIPSAIDVKLTRGNRSSILLATKTAIKQALDDLQGCKPSLAIIFSCISRRTMLGIGVYREVEFAQQILGADVPIIGMYCAGEYSPVGGKNLYHNCTFCICLISDKQKIGDKKSIICKKAEIEKDKILLITPDEKDETLIFTCKKALETLAVDLKQIAESSILNNLNNVLRADIPNLVILTADNINLIPQILMADRSIQIIILANGTGTEAETKTETVVYNPEEPIFILNSPFSSAELNFLVKRTLQINKMHVDHQKIKVELVETNEKLIHAENSIEMSEKVLTENYKEIEKSKDNLEKTLIELKETQDKLIETSRKAGMSEIATGVIHNVGNLLNSVNVSIDVISEQINKSAIKNFFNIAELIKQNIGDIGNFFTNNNKGKLIPEYLLKFAEIIKGEQHLLKSEIADLNKYVDHIKNIISIQQSLAGYVGLIEEHSLIKLIENSINLNENTLKRHNVQIVKEFENDIKINTDRLKIIQILDNLIRNAKQACDENKEISKKEIIIKLTKNDNTAIIDIIDNGIGIPEGNITKIFHYGFTTRENGHGFGLHNSALSTKELGGELLAFSDGIGKGAKFSLKFPMG